MGDGEPQMRPYQTKLYSEAALRDSPSMRDGVTVEQEARLRCAACQLVVAGGAMLNLPHDATLSAASFVLRFYAERSWVQFADPMPIVSACIFLASKLEEVPRRISDIVNAMNRLQHPRAAVRSAAEGGGEVPVPVALTQAIDTARRERAAVLPSSVPTTAPAAPPDILVGDSYYDAKQRLIADEQHVLRALVFDVGQFQPHKWLLNMCRSCRCSARVTQHACAVLNDSILCTTQSLQHPQEVLAASALNMSVLLQDAAGEMPPQWWRCVGVDMAVLETIGHELVDLYAQQPPGGKTAAVTPSSAVGAPIVLYRRQAT